MDFHSVLTWITQHPHLATAAVFLLAAAESLALVGLVVPGATGIVAAGAFVALGAMDFWPTLAAAALGAIVGDGLSYWIGFHYRERLRALWPFSRHPGWLSRGEAFFLRHGGKSVLFGRFVGAVRPIIPLIAGMLGMRPAAFYGVNVLSAVAWAPAYLLPGLAVGLSLALAGQIAARLVALLALFGAMILLTWLSVRWLFLLLRPRARRLAQWSLERLGRHGRVGTVFAGLLDPARREQRALLISGIMLIGSAWLFFLILEDVVTGAPLVRVDQGVYQMLQSLRTPSGDKVVVVVTELGDTIVIAAVAVAVFGWLAWRRAWRAMGYWAACICFGQLTTTMLKSVLQRPRPESGLYEGMSAYSFPSGHATMSTVVYGFLAVLVARELAPERRWLPYAVTASLVGAIALSRLYLGAHWMSDVVGGMSLGLVWISLLAIGYFRHGVVASLGHGLTAAAALALVLGGAWHAASTHVSDLERYARKIEVRKLNAQSWWREDWRELPAHRRDLGGELEQPFNVQWAGTLPALRRRLAVGGWREPVALSAASSLLWLTPAPEIGELPVLPQVHAGRNDALHVVRPLARPPEGPQSGAQRQIILRLWQSGIALEPSGAPLWIGSVSLQRLRHVLLLRVPAPADAYDDALDALARSLAPVEQRAVRRSSAASSWSGTILLLRESRD